MAKAHWLRAGAGAVAVVAAVALAGCSAPGPPPGPTAADREQRTQKLLDATWAATGLEGSVERPEVTQAPANDDEWSLAVSECARIEGFSGLSAVIGDGEALMLGPDATAGQQLAFYTCIARYPPPSWFFGEELLTREQVDYVLDYWSRWLIPCIELHGYDVNSVPVRGADGEYLHDLRIGSPYSAAFSAPVDDLRTLYEECGSERAGVPGGELRWVLPGA